MRTFKGIKYFIKKAHTGLMLTIPALKLSVPVDDTFTENDLLTYI